MDNHRRWNRWGLEARAPPPKFLKGRLSPPPKVDDDDDACMHNRCGFIQKMAEQAEQCSIISFFSKRQSL